MKHERHTIHIHRRCLPHKAFKDVSPENLYAVHPAILSRTYGSLLGFSNLEHQYQKVNRAVILALSISLLIRSFHSLGRGVGLISKLDMHSQESSHITSPYCASPSTGKSHSESPSLTTTTSSSLQTLFFDAVEAANPPLRQLASHSTLGSFPSAAASEQHPSRDPTDRAWPGPTFEEQRHPGKPGAAITRTGNELDSEATNVASNSTAPTKAVKSEQSGYLGSQSGSSSSQNGSSDAPTFNSMGSLGQGEREEEENIYPRPLARTLIIIGLCLSVFLISLDRTIITTVRIQAAT